MSELVTRLFGILCQSVNFDITLKQYTIHDYVDNIWPQLARLLYDYDRCSLIC